MAIDFPNSPAENDTFTASGKTWVYADGKWAVQTITNTFDLKAPLASPTFTGTVSGVSASMVGLGNVDNTSDVNKPVSTAGQTALDLKANLSSPTFTGTPTLPTGTIATTQTAGESSTALATTAFVGTAVSNLVDSAPATLNTLDELANALGDDANFATTVATNIGLKAPLASPTFTGTVTVPAPTNNTDAATKAYVDGATFVLNDGSITTAKIADANVTAAKIASNAVTEEKINDGAVTQSKLASGFSGITVTTTANRSAVIPSPFNGQFIFLTDTSQLQRWDGSQWIVASTTVPTGAPTGLALVSATSTTATISFSAGGDGGSTITNYQFALSTNGGATFGSYAALNPADGSSPITITGLAMGTAHQVKLKAVNALGTGSVESSAVSFTTGNMTIEALIVGGGGGGGCSLAGGGGGGGVATATTSIGIGTQSIVVGAGGAGGSGTGVFGVTGVTSSAFGQAVKGGTGGNSRFGGSATTGANGGGGAAGGGGRNGSQGVIDTAISGFTTYGGFRGGNNGGDSDNYPGGGGGGANANGQDAANGSSKAGDGGAGKQISGIGSDLYWGGGGGGSSYVGANGAGNGGIGGGGGGSDNGGGSAGTGGGSAQNTGGNGLSGGGNTNANQSGGSGGANTGGGGGASNHEGSNPNGTGGSGVVIVRYLTTDAAGTTITGGTATTSGAYTVRTFTASGSLVLA